MAQIPQEASSGGSVPRVGHGSSLTHKVLEAMVSAVRLGTFESGRLPPEDELAAQLGVSRTTVRRALQSMEQIGLIERRPGRGTRLRTHARPDLLALHGLVPFPTLLRELGHDVTSKVSWRRLEGTPPNLAVQTGHDADGSSYELNILLVADDVPAVSMLERFPIDVLGSMPSDQDLQAGSILFLSERCFDRPIDHALASLEPRVSGALDGDGSTAEAQLELESGTAFLELQEIFYSAEEHPLAISTVAINPALITFSVFRRFL
jgi:GntR family transcriptional regulator